MRVCVHLLVYVSLCEFSFLQEEATNPRGRRDGEEESKKVHVRIHVTYISVRAYIYTGIHVRVYIHIQVYVHTHISIYLIMYSYVYLCIYIYIYICIDIHIYICIYVYM